MPSSWICGTLGSTDRTREGKHSRDEASSNYRPSEKQAEDAGHAAASKIGIKTGQQYGQTDVRREKEKLATGFVKWSIEDVEDNHAGPGVHPTGLPASSLSWGSQPLPLATGRSLGWDQPS